MLICNLKKMHDKLSQVELTDLAYRHPKYKKWLDDYSKKAKNKVLTSDKYNNIYINNKTRSKYG